MHTFDANGDCTEHADIGCIDPTHPNYYHDPRWRGMRKLWVRGTMPLEESTPPPATEG
jgi:hypothetical protein